MIYNELKKDGKTLPRFSIDTCKLMALLKREEGPKLDFKAKINLKPMGKKEFVKDVIATQGWKGIYHFWR